MQQFESLEKGKLKALPSQAFELSKYQQAKVHPNCHVVLSEDNMGTPSPLLSSLPICRQESKHKVQ